MVLNFVALVILATLDVLCHVESVRVMTVASSSTPVTSGLGKVGETLTLERSSQAFGVGYGLGEGVTWESFGPGAEGDNAVASSENWLPRVRCLESMR